MSHRVLDFFIRTPVLQTALRSIAAGEKRQFIYGVEGSQKSFITAGLQKTTGRSCLVVTEQPEQAEELKKDLENLLPETRVFLFPILEVLPYDVLAMSTEAASLRIQVLTHLLQGEKVVVVAPAKALANRMPPPASFASCLRKLCWGDQLDLEKMTSYLVQCGYERAGIVEEKGQFSIRGGIIDVFPPHAENPFRIELFGDEIDSIREFDLNSQRSIGNISEIMIAPAREFVLDQEILSRGEENLRCEFGRQEELFLKNGSPQAVKNLREKMARCLESIQGNNSLENIEQYLPFFFPQLNTFLSYFPEDTLIIWDELSRIKERIEEARQEMGSIVAALLPEGKVLPRQMELYADSSDILGEAGRYTAIDMALLPKKVSDYDPQTVISVDMRSNLSFHGQTESFLSEIRRLLDDSHRVFFFVETEARKTRLQQILSEAGIYPVDQEETTGISISAGTLQDGFLYPAGHLAVVTDREIFGKPQHGVSRKAVRSKDAAPISAFTELKVGDYVVHATHGIGKYMGVETLEVGGVAKDYLFVRYAGEDKLYIPTDQINLLQKYVGDEDKSPRLSKLGGSEWNKVRSRVKESVQELARELLALYAERSQARGFAFSPDTPWQREFEEDFPYEETPDQLRSIREIKSDMERPFPMDRLLCGDVGYGKTEVALRAAFKSVADEKQVAVLVPTTILAQQHYNTFKERFEKFPFTVEMLSRFRTPAEQKKIIQGLKSGQVDIVIGTHRLLQRDIKFKDLGLLVIDEEQRFGVKHKEKLKRLKQNVDVLTLSATPIPRTLYMSLIGARDMSVIETPPENRYPVQTFVMEHSWELVRDVIRREIARGGQVYYVHNRIQDIEKIAEQLQSIIPNLRLVIGHGQMSEETLEDVMLGFTLHEYDVLLCTTIIETGLDIPNVNTLIVDSADKMGLSQLYQLRGRVGRSNRLAYAYFTFERDKVLSEVAEKRLHAIREFTEFGSGFKIAMRDLEIRGAGNILGPEQHGHILAVGFEMYCQMLEDAVRELKGEAVPQLPEPLLELNVDAYIPKEYITDEKQKIAIYKRLGALDTLEEVQEMEDEILDRYGEMPIPVSNLLQVLKIKVLAKELLVASIKRQKGSCLVQYQQGKVFSKGFQQKIIGTFPGRLRFQPGRTPYFNYALSATAEKDVLEEILFFLNRQKELEREEQLPYNEGKVINKEAIE